MRPGTDPIMVLMSMRLQDRGNGIEAAEALFNECDDNVKLVIDRAIGAACMVWKIKNIDEFKRLAPDVRQRIYSDAISIAKGDNGVLTPETVESPHAAGLVDTTGHPLRRAFGEVPGRPSAPPGPPQGPDLPEGLTYLPFNSGAVQIMLERTRQISQLGYTPEADQVHDDYELIEAAMAFIDAAVRIELLDDGETLNTNPPDIYPWDASNWKINYYADPLGCLVRAGALIAAEIDRRIQASD